MGRTYLTNGVVAVKPQNFHTGNRRKVMICLGKSGHPQKDDPTKPSSIRVCGGLGGLVLVVSRGRLGGIETLRITAFVVQAPLDEQLAGLFTGHGNLLVACVKNHIL